MLTKYLLQAARLGKANGLPDDVLTLTREQIALRNDFIRAGRCQHAVILKRAVQRPELLLSQRVHSVQQEALAYLLALKNYPLASRQYLVVFHHDFLQMIYSLLEKTGAQAHDLFRDKDTAALSETACDSVDRMRAWVTHVLGACKTCIEQAAKSGGAIDSVKRYIEEHLADELNRNALAAAVFLSPDYLSHLFAEKENTSLTNYINARRIRRAKEMLLQGSLSIRDVALKSGFQNISYFSKQFKRQTGCTPQEFRKVSPHT